MNSEIPELKLTNSNFKLVMDRKKMTSIRLGHKDITPGLCYAVNVDTGARQMINIWYVNRGLVSDLDLNDARLDGCATVEELKAELRRCYERHIDDRESMTQVHFDVVADYENKVA